MLKYAKIINKQTKEVDVGIGSNTVFFARLGMQEMEVERTAEGRWYVSGFAPKDTAAQLRAFQAYLRDTDWYAVRFAETGKEIPADVLAARQAAREEIDRLREAEE